MQEMKSIICYKGVKSLYSKSIILLTILPVNNNIHLHYARLDWPGNPQHKLLFVSRA